MAQRAYCRHVCRVRTVPCAGRGEGRAPFLTRANPVPPRGPATAFAPPACAYTPTGSSTSPPTRQPKARTRTLGAPPRRNRDGGDGCHPFRPSANRPTANPCAMHLPRSSSLRRGRSYGGKRRDAGWHGRWPPWALRRRPRRKPPRAEAPCTPPNRRRHGCFASPAGQVPLRRGDPTRPHPHQRAGDAPPTPSP